MNLLLIRHAIAEDREDFARRSQNDDLRPLTNEGREKMARGAAGLCALVPEIDLLATSPLVRARETAEIVARAYGIAVHEVTPVLRPFARPAEFTAWSRAHSGKDVVAVVGHEPHLGELVTWLLADDEDSPVTFKKGGACLVSFSGYPARGEGVLEWLQTPAALRALAD